MTFKIASLAAGAALLALTPAAFAADMPVASAPVEAMVAENTSFDWSGFYAGLHVGYAGVDFGDDEDFDDEDFDADGVFGGGQIGFNVQSGSWVFGVEADGSVADLSIDAEDGADEVGMDLNWFATGRGRIGYAFDSVLLYGTGGVAFGGVDADGSDDDGDFDSDDVQVGYAVGGGIEVSLTESISAKAEYLYLDLGEESLGDDTEIDLDAHTAKVGVNFHF